MQIVPYFIFIGKTIALGSRALGKQGSKLLRGLASSATMSADLASHYSSSSHFTDSSFPNLVVSDKWAFDVGCAPWQTTPHRGGAWLGGHYIISGCHLQTLSLRHHKDLPFCVRCHPHTPGIWPVKQEVFVAEKRTCMHALRSRDPHA